MRELSKEPTSTPKLVLVIAFIGAFISAWLAVVAVSLSFRRAHVSPAVSSKDEVATLFADSVSITRSGTVLSVAHNDALNPGSSDFMLFVWIKLKDQIDPNERSTFIGKYDPKEENAQGYAVALIGGADGVRPHVYWQNSSGKGRWYAFASTHIDPDRWYLMAVTFRAQRYLGVHIAPYGSDSKPEVLGGYDLDGAIVPASSAKLSIGAFKRSQFRGQVGPFGVFQKIDVSKEGSEIIKRLARAPAFEDHPVDDEEIALWASPIEDLGPLRLHVDVAP